MHHNVPAGIYNYYGTVNISDSELHHNGEGLYNGGPPGHPYCNRGAAGLGCSTVTNSVIRDNTGMGINNNGDLTIIDSMVVYNKNTVSGPRLALPAPHRRPPGGRPVAAALRTPHPCARPPAAPPRSAGPRRRHRERLEPECTPCWCHVPNAPHQHDGLLQRARRLRRRATIEPRRVDAARFFAGASSRAPSSY